MRAAVDEVLVPTFVGLCAVADRRCCRWPPGSARSCSFAGCCSRWSGSPAASLAFGLAHVAGARMLAFGVWAAGMGVVLGGLALATGGLLASMTAHACYDVLAFNYLGAEARRQENSGARR